MVGAIALSWLDCHTIHCKVASYPTIAVGSACSSSSLLSLAAAWLLGGASCRAALDSIPAVALSDAPTSFGEGSASKGNVSQAYRLLRRNRTKRKSKGPSLPWDNGLNILCNSGRNFLPHNLQSIGGDELSLKYVS